MAARVLPANTNISVWFRTDLDDVTTDNSFTPGASLTLWADGVLWDNTNNRAIPPEHMGFYPAFFSTPSESTTQ
jgi:hypothetical protein